MSFSYQPLKSIAYLVYILCNFTNLFSHIFAIVELYKFMYKNNVVHYRIYYKYYWSLILDCYKVSTLNYTCMVINMRARIKLKKYNNKLH